MKNSQKIQFVLTPIFICILSIMLVVVSFSWYKASVSTNVKTESSEVSIKAEAPKGVDVALTLTPIGDDYQVSTVEGKDVYSLTMKPSADNPDVGILNGYYGQTGLKTYPDLDKVYIAFYKAVVSSSANNIDINSAYIKESVVSKKNTTDIKVSATDESSSPYQVRFYTGTETEISETGGTETSSTITSSAETTVAETSSAETSVTSTSKKYTFSNESGTFAFTGAELNSVSKKYELTIYVGIKFIASVNSTATSNTDGSFLYSDIKYFGSKFTLTACFINSPVS